MSLASSNQGPELLAPAGDWDALKAALDAGADAVYFGLSDGFNARARATNFSLSELSRVLVTIHHAARRGYLALNTLVRDSEWDALFTLVRGAADAGVDALIVQDLGVARRVAEWVPSMALHASTQMTCTDGDAILLASRLGLRRITLPRELTLSELEVLRASTSLELEVFAHGALCIAYSGQCLLSEAFGGRSANRGMCAQPCRLSYELLVDGQPRKTSGSHLLSPRDLDASSLVAALMATGVQSLKIEGRQKSPEYVKAATFLYRKAIDAAVSGGQVSLEEERGWVHQAFSRGEHSGHLTGTSHRSLVNPKTSDHVGLSLGTYTSTLHEGGKSWLVISSTLRLALGDGIVVGPSPTGHEVGGRVWAMLLDGRPVSETEPCARLLVWLGPDVLADGLLAGTEVRRTSSPRAERELEHAVAQHRPRKDVVARLSGHLGERPSLEFRSSDGGLARVIVESVLEPARTHGLSVELVADKLGRLGDTPFRLLRVEMDIDPGATISTSALNRARRELVEQLLTERCPAHVCKPAGSDVVAAVNEAAGSGVVAAVNEATGSDVAAAVNEAAGSGVAAAASIPGGLFVTCRTEEQARSALSAGADGVYLELGRFAQIRRVFAALRDEGFRGLSVVTPRLQKPGEEPMEPRLLALQPDSILVRSLGSVERLARLGAGQLRATDGGERRDGAPGARDGGERRDGAPTARNRPLLVGDFTLNVTNAVSAGVLLAAGLDVLTPSVELRGAEVVTSFGADLSRLMEVVVQSPLPLMHTEFCLHAAYISSAERCGDCSRPCDEHTLSLRDGAGHLLAVTTDGNGRSTVYLGEPRRLCSELTAVARAGVRRFRVELLREDGKQTEEIVRRVKRESGANFKES